METQHWNRSVICMVCFGIRCGTDSHHAWEDFTQSEVPVYTAYIYSPYSLYNIYITFLKNTLYMMYVQKTHPPFKCSTVSISLSCFFNDVFFFKTKPRSFFFGSPLDPRLRWIGPRLQELKITEIREKISQKEGWIFDGLD